jgi:hypothetical protein
MAVLLRGDIYVAPGGPKRVVDVSVMMWCDKEGKMVADPYHSMTDNGVRAHLKDQMKKAGDDGLKSMFDDIMFVKSS